MGYVRIQGTIANALNRSLKRELEFIVGKGAIYTLIPKSIAAKLQLKETDRRKFKIVGEVVEYPVSEAYITIEGRSVTSLVAIADEKTPVLLGVTTLELLGLRVDPATGRLTSLELMILRVKDLVEKYVSKMIKYET